MNENIIIRTLFNDVKKKKFQDFHQNLLNFLYEYPNMLIQALPLLYKKFDEQKLTKDKIDDLLTTLFHVDLQNPLSLIGARTEIQDIQF